MPSGKKACELFDGDRGFGGKENGFDDAQVLAPVGARMHSHHGLRGFHFICLWGVACINVHVCLYHNSIPKTLGAAAHEDGAKRIILAEFNKAFADQFKACGKA